MPIPRKEIERMKSEEIERRKQEAGVKFTNAVTNAIDLTLKEEALKLNSSVNLTIFDQKVKIGLEVIDVPKHMTDEEVLDSLEQIYKKENYETHATVTDTLKTLTILFT